MQKLPLTLTVITKNEERNIERCLRSVPFASEIIVVDGESTDRTVEIAQKLGAQVFIEEWKGFGPQKQLAVDRAKNDWILSLDADEALSPELATEIQQKFASLKPEVGYQLPRRSFHLGRWIDYGGWFPDRQLRLFHRKHGKWTPVQIHEKVLTSTQESLNSPIHHWVFQSLAHQVKTNDRYSSLQAEELFQKGQRYSFFKLLIKPYSKFIETYFLKRGFLDGLPGFIISISAAYSVFLKWSKLWELELRQRRGEK